MINKIKEDLTYARKAGIKDKVGFLSMLYSDAMMIAKNKKKELPSDEECISVIKKIMKGCKDTVAHLEKVPHLNRDYAAIYNHDCEIEILYDYLPKQLTKEELMILLEEQDISNIGQTMKFFKDNYPNQYDGKYLSSLIRELSK